jgi:hypothetical protein
MTDPSEHHADQYQEEDCRKFLATCGKSLAATSPVTTFLLSTFLNSTDIAHSLGWGADRGNRGELGGCDGIPSGKSDQG